MRDRAVPDGWRVARLDEIAEVVGGSTPSTKVPSYWDGHICWATPTDITALKSRYISDTATKITEHGLKSTGLRLLPPGAILVTSRATVGACAISAVPIATNQGFASLVCKDGVEPEFLYYHISARQGELAQLSAGSTFTELPRRTFRRLPILLPPLPEQRKIAEILSSVDDAIERTEAVIEQVRRVKQGLMHVLLTGRARVAPGLRPVTRDGAVPDGWRRVTIGDVAEVVGGSTPSTRVEGYWGGGIRWATPTDVTGLRSRYIADTAVTITEEGLRSAGLRLLPPGSILVTSRATVGACAINTAPIATNQGFASLVCKDGVEPEFLYYHVLARQKELARLSAGSTFPELPRRTFRKLPLLLPPPPEQRKIAEILSSVDDAIERTEAVIEQVRRVKQGLMHLLLTGQVRVRVDARQAVGAD